MKEYQFTVLMNVVMRTAVSVEAGSMEEAEAKLKNNDFSFYDDIERKEQSYGSTETFNGTEEI